MKRNGVLIPATTWKAITEKFWWWLYNTVNVINITEVHLNGYNGKFHIIYFNTFLKIDNVVS